PSSLSYVHYATLILPSFPTRRSSDLLTPLKTIKIFSLKNPLSDLILLVYLLKQRRGTYGSVILLYALSCRKSVLLYGRNKRFCCCGNILFFPINKHR